MRPTTLSTRIFLDSGDPAEARATLALLGFLDGQTTNPSLIAKNPEALARKAAGKPFGPQEIWDFYQDVVREISDLLPQGSVSVEVYADGETPARRMMEQAEECFTWIPNAHIKLPSCLQGLEAARMATAMGIPVNMTLCFTQAQAAAVHVATLGATRGHVFVSPFVGRLDDKGDNGMDLIANVLKMYRQGGSHVEVLTASVRSMEHFMYTLALGSDIITAPFSLLKAWADVGMPVPGPEYVYAPKYLTPIPYADISLENPLEDYDVSHPLTDMGMAKFSADWNALMGQ